jgi:hypothetical protein
MHSRKNPRSAQGDRLKDQHESAAVRHARDYDEGVEKLVRAEQLDTAIRLAPMPIIIFSVILQFIVWVFFEPRYQNYFVTLELVTLSLATQGLRFCLRWSRGTKPDEISSDLLRRICVFGAACGLTIGSIPPMVYVDAGLEQRLLVAATVTGLIGTSMTLSVMPPLALSFFLPIVVAWFATLAATGETCIIYVAFLLAAYTIFLSFLTLFFSRLVKKHVVAQTNFAREQTLTTLLLNDFEECCWRSKSACKRRVVWRVRSLALKFGKSKVICRRTRLPIVAGG